MGEDLSKPEKPEEGKDFILSHVIVDESVVLAIARAKELIKKLN